MTSPFLRSTPDFLISMFWAAASFPVGDFAEGIERLDESEGQVAKDVHSVELSCGVRIQEGFIFADLAHLAPPGIGDHPAEWRGHRTAGSGSRGPRFLLFGEDNFAFGGLTSDCNPRP